MAERGFTYWVSDDAIREHLKLSPLDKLRWLLEANAFIEKFAPPRTKRLHELFRSGKI